MNFVLKSRLQHILSILPGGRNLNYFLQRHVSKSLPVSDHVLEHSRRMAMWHVSNYRKTFLCDPVSIYEFGSGWDLKIAMMVAAETGARVVATDITFSARRELIGDMLRRLGLESLRAANVIYSAPCDARNTGLTDTFDMVMSTAVLEHVPAKDIPSILNECRRLVAPTGICSFIIDYSDHWAYSDKSIAPINFLKFDDRAWNRYNPSLQYQNRLRHSDYLKMFRAAGFEVTVLSTESFEGPMVTLAPQFAGYAEDDLRIVGSFCMLRPIN